MTNIEKIVQELSEVDRLLSDDPNNSKLVERKLLLSKKLVEANMLIGDSSKVLKG